MKRLFLLLALVFADGARAQEHSDELADSQTLDGNPCGKYFRVIPDLDTLAGTRLSFLTASHSGPKQSSPGSGYFAFDADLDEMYFIYDDQRRVPQVSWWIEGKIRRFEIQISNRDYQDSCLYHPGPFGKPVFSAPPDW